MIFLEELACAIREWFPKLEGRALAVSEQDPFTKDNKPQLPIAIVALLRETYTHNANSRYGRLTVETNFIVDFIVPPVRYKRDNGGESPFWSYYDYEEMRNTLLSNLQAWEHGGGIEFVQLDVEADAFAVYLGFRFRRRFDFRCEPDDPKPGKITFSVTPAKGCIVPEPAQQEEQETS